MVPNVCSLSLDGVAAYFLLRLCINAAHFWSNWKKTRRLAACTQAVIILRSTSYIAIERKCSAFEVVRNSIESMCSSYSAFDCISWNRLIAYYSSADLKHVKWVKIVISAYERFSLHSLAFAVVCLFFHFSSKRDILISELWQCVT